MREHHGFSIIKANFLVCFVFLVLTFSAVKIYNLVSKDNTYIVSANCEMETLLPLGEEGEQGTSYEKARDAIIAFKEFYKRNTDGAETVLLNYTQARTTVVQDALDKDAEIRYKQLTAEKDYYKASQDILALYNKPNNKPTLINITNRSEIAKKLTAYSYNAYSNTLKNSPEIGAKERLNYAYFGDCPSGLIDDKGCKYNYYNNGYKDHFLNKKPEPIEPIGGRAFNGGEQLFGLYHFDPNKMTLKFEGESGLLREDELKKRNAGTYFVIVSLNEDYTWDDLTFNDVKCPFTIKKKVLYDPNDVKNSERFPKLEDAYFPYDGKLHRLVYTSQFIEGNGIVCNFSGNGAVDPGVYKVKLELLISPEEERGNYEAIPSQYANIIIQREKVTAKNDSRFVVSSLNIDSYLDPRTKLSVWEVYLNSLSDGQKEAITGRMRPMENIGNIYEVKYRELDRENRETNTHIGGVDFTMIIPKELRGKHLRVVHVYEPLKNIYTEDVYDLLPTNANDIVEDAPYFTREGDLITLHGVESFSTFCFLYENSTLSSLAIFLIILSVFVFALLVAFLVLFILWKNGRNVGLMAPIFERMKHRKLSAQANTVGTVIESNIIPNIEVKKARKVRKEKAINTKKEEGAMKKAVKKAPAKKVVKKAPAKKPVAKKAVKKAPAKKR